jgi:hypothetical protein
MNPSLRADLACRAFGLGLGTIAAGALWGPPLLIAGMTLAGVGVLIWPEYEDDDATEVPI